MLKRLKKPFPAAKVLRKVYDKSINFEVASVAPYTFMTLILFDRIEKHLHLLDLTDIKMQSYSEHRINILGSIQVNMSFRNNSCKLSLPIVE